MARTGLDRQRIVAVALDLVDEVGLDGLSTRALATRLQVQSPALYWHFANKEALVAAMADAMMVGLPDAESAPELMGRRAGRAAVSRWLADRAQLFRRVLLSRRDGARIHAGSRPPAARLAGVEVQLTALHRVGFTPIAAARVTVAISRFVVGWVLEEQAGDPHPEQAGDPLAYPVLTAASAALDESDPDAEFTACLTAVVDGLVRSR